MIYYKTTLLVADRFSFPIEPERGIKHRIPSALRSKIKESIAQYNLDFVDNTLANIEKQYLLPEEKESLLRALKIPGFTLCFELYSLTSPEKIFSCMRRYQLSTHNFYPSYYTWIKLPVTSKHDFIINIDNELYLQDVNYREALQQLKITT